MEAQKSKSLLTLSLQVSVYFGIVILIFDFFLLLINKANTFDPYNFWTNVKYLIWAIGIYNSFRWLQTKIIKISFIEYLIFAFFLAIFVSLFDIFFFLLYSKFFNPEIQNTIISKILEQNNKIFNKKFSDLQIDFEQYLHDFFYILFSLSLWFNYIITFLFYSFFFALFIKFSKKKNL